MYYIEQRISERISETPQGFLLCQDVPIARTGTQEYLAREIGITDEAPNTVITVDRLEEDVMQPDVLASFEGATVTLGHPVQQITAANHKVYAVGHIQNVHRGTGDQSHLIIGDMLITDPATIAQIRSGLREVSCGYDCHYEQDEAGRWRQTNIRGNHVAIVPRGRAGPECSIKDQIMSKLKDTVQRIFGKAQDEALAVIAQGEKDVAAADGKTEPTAPVVAQPVLDAIAAGKLIGVKVVDGKIEVATDADMSRIIADLMERQQYYDSCIKDLQESRDATAMALKKLNAPDPEDDGTTDAAPKDAQPKPVTDADVIARAEILAPGITMVEGVELAALQRAYTTADGKKFIDMLSGGKVPTADNVAALFVPVSELIKTSRAAALTVPATKDAKAADAIAAINQKSATIHPLF